MDDEHDLVLVQRRLVTAVRQLADEPDVNLLAQDLLEDLLRVAGAHDQVDVREVLEAAEDEREDVGRDRGAAPTSSSPACPPAARAGAPALGERLHRALRVRAEGAALGGEPHAARGADEKLDPELALELLDPGRQRGLRDVEHGRRSADRAALGDGEERLDLGQEH